MYRTLQAAWSVIDDAAEIIFPRECLVCRRAVRGVDLCYRCTPDRHAAAASLAKRCTACFSPFLQSTHDGHQSFCPACTIFPSAVDRFRFLWEYGELARDLIRAMKYNPSVRCARLCGKWLAEELPRLLPDGGWDLIVPVPSSPTMLARRDFHPCVEIARELHRSQGIPVKQILHHRGKRSPQAHRSYEERLTGVRGLFTIKNPDAVRDARILVVEDVITTGATIEAAAKALLAAGAASVDVVALARARVWGRFRARVVGAPAMARRPPGRHEQHELPMQLE